MIDRAKRLQAVFYEASNGTEPVRDWLLALSDDDRRIVGKDIAKVEFGWPIGMPYCRSMGSGLWEIRSAIGGGRITRILFCIDRDRIVLLHGFVKKTRATPKDELERARKRMKEIS